MKDSFWSQGIKERVEAVRVKTEEAALLLSQIAGKELKWADEYTDWKGVDFFIGDYTVQAKVRRNGKTDMVCALRELNTGKLLSEHPSICNCSHYCLITDFHTYLVSSKIIKEVLFELEKKWEEKYQATGSSKHTSYYKGAKITVMADTDNGKPTLIAWIPNSLMKLVV